MSEQMYLVEQGSAVIAVSAGPANSRGARAWQAAGRGPRRTVRGGARSHAQRVPRRPRFALHVDRRRDAAPGGPRMTAPLAEIRLHPSPILRTASMRVENTWTCRKEARELADQMLAVMHASPTPGVGLAAQQVGRLLRVMVWNATVAIG